MKDIMIMSLFKSFLNVYDRADFLTFPVKGSTLSTLLLHLLFLDEFYADTGFSLET